MIKSLSQLLLGSLLIATDCYAQVDQIIQSIEQEKANPQQVHPVQKPSQNRVQKPKTTEQTPQQSEVQKVPSIQVWGPDDHLPQNIAGQLLVGDFIVSSQSPEGHAVLKAVTGGKGRTFEIDNMTAGLPPGQWQFFPTDQAQRVHFSKENPLVFIERGALGYYTVRASHAGASVQPPNQAYATGGNNGLPYGSYYVPNPPTQPAQTTDLPYGTPVPGRPGFVMSPYSPSAGNIDVRGFVPGSEVRDPYSGRVFLVP
jgi:hypothetical protein